MSRVIQKAPNINLAKLEVGKTYEFQLRNGTIVHAKLTGQDTFTGYPHQLTYKEGEVDYFEIFLSNGSALALGVESRIDIIQVSEVTP